ncbi:hypothetical protein B0G38_001542 [Arthrobacter sp. VKM Ac-2550]|nr:hypothetical protein [Arthrobacter sp. VKM Ac-2550]
MVAADLSDAALDVARRMGADQTVNPGRGDNLPQDIDVAIEASGAPVRSEVLSPRSAEEGSSSRSAICRRARCPSRWGDIVTREIDYRGSYRFVDEISRALELMAGGVDVSPLMTHEVSIDDAVRELAADRSTG